MASMALQSVQPKMPQQQKQQPPKQQQQQQPQDKKKNGQYASLQFFRTALCNDFKKGFCPRGDKCTFAHGEENLASRPRLTKTKMCPHKVCTNENCGYAHSRKELVSTGSFWKTEMCRFGGQCKIKSTCRFAHDGSELRSKTYNGTDITEEEKLLMESQGRTQAEADNTERIRSNETPKNKAQYPNNLDVKLGELIEVAGDNRETTLLSVDEAAELCPVFSDDANSYHQSDISESERNTTSMTALDIILEHCPSANELWMAAAFNPLLTPMQKNCMPAQVPLPMPGGTGMPGATGVMPGSPGMPAATGTVPMARPWWTITEDDLVFAMPEYYED